MSQRTRLLLLVGFAIVAWFAITVRWAILPLSDTQSVGFDANKVVVHQTTECGSVFDSSPTGGKVVPALVTPPEVLAVVPPLPQWAYGRPPCELVHEHSRLVFGIDVVAFLVAMGVFGFVAVRTRPHADDKVSALPA
jgi:hypothetical protein